MSKAVVDSFLLMGANGSGAPYIGTFEDGAGQPDWNGWNPHDETYGTVNHWHADTYNAPAGAYAAYCGDATIPSCGPGDPEGGYGNNYRDFLDWRGTVANAALPCTVRVTALVNHHSEEGYDYSHLGFVTAGEVRTNVWTMDGVGSGVVLDETFVYQPGDYVGDGLDEVQVTFMFESDGAGSDEDCFYSGFGNGGVQVDDVVITLDNGTGASHDFEDGTLGPFAPRDLGGVGNFAALWSNLDDVDPCVDNHSVQVAFIDDGIVVPGTGGSPCNYWCYGPGGYVVSTTGGLVGPEARLHSSVRSPVMPWPNSGHDGALLEYTVYDQGVVVDWSGIFFAMEVRSTDTGDPGAIESEPWKFDGLFKTGLGTYQRRQELQNGYLTDPTHIQIRFSAIEFGWLFGFNGDNGTPGPYLDNVRLTTFVAPAAELSARPEYLAQDGFPATGVLDTENPANNSVRFDMAFDIGFQDWGPPVAGDSVLFDAPITRAAAVRHRTPRLYYRLEPNPDYDPHRTSGLPLAGYVLCDSVLNTPGPTVADRWSADLPDEGFLFPGDRLHYYFEFITDTGGLQETHLLPADTTGFGNFYGESPYDIRFSISGLPTPDVDFLWWDDSGQVEDWPLWLETFAGLCYGPGDIFRSPAGVDGVGLGARANADLLSQYRTIVYVSGREDDKTLGANEGNDPSPDVQVLEAWLDQGGHHLAVLGSGVAEDLNAGTVSGGFMRNRLGVDVTLDDLVAVIDGQTEPLILGTGFFTWAEYWTVDLVCAGAPPQRALRPSLAGERLAEFAGPGGVPGTYIYVAASRVQGVAPDWEAVLVPFDVARVTGGPTGVPARSAILHDILINFGQLPFYIVGCGYSDVPEQDLPAVFSARSYPNPFNPRVRIDYTVARPGHLTVKIIDLRGRLVATLADGPVAESGHLVWDGRNSGGGQAASGVYFYQVRVDNEVKIGKMALIR